MLRGLSDDGVLFNVGVVCFLVIGLRFILGGVRPAGAAVLGAVSGAVVGVMLVAPELDLLPSGAVFAEAGGAVVFCIVGLTWRLSVSRSTLRWLASATLVATALIILCLASELTCHAVGHTGRPCLPIWGDGVLLVLLAVEAWFVALLFRARLPSASGGPRRERKPRVPTEGS